jgi:hypothetical protein
MLPVMRHLGQFAVGSILAMGLLAGCSSKLETGYQPRMLGSSNETRRGYYAQPFTPEARAAKEYEDDFGTPGGRPKPGY